MPEKTKWYWWVKFQPDVIAEGLRLHAELRGPDEYEVKDRRITFDDNESWEHDTDEEFFADYRSPRLRSASISQKGCSVFHRDLAQNTPGSRVTVRLPERNQVERVFEVFERAVPVSRMAHPHPDPVVFIGHGHSDDWRSLKDFLRERAQYRVTNFEAEPRASQMNLDVLVEMAKQASVAVLVHTAEDEVADEVRARQNVVHETGFFQGHFGFEKVIIVREEGTAGFTNIQGVQEIRYPPGQIPRVHGEVQAALDDRFPDRVRKRR